jgi:ATP-binding protein involved in chromosome partitioning
MELRSATFPSKVIYVYSGKGGVGKSTVCVNLAYALAQQGISVGLFDADLSGPSVPTMVHQLETVPPRLINFKVIPGTYGGVHVNSIGFISEPIEGGYWQGKYLEGVLNQMLLHTDWQGAEVLVIDMPPGTGEIHRAIFSAIRGKAVIVTTPQDLSYSDSVRAIEMLQRMKVDIIGVVENMAYYRCDCGKLHTIFKGNTERDFCIPHGLSILLRIAINAEISAGSNSGVPFIVSDQQASAEACDIRALARTVYETYDQVKTVRPTN